MSPLTSPRSILMRTSESAMGPTCSPSITRCQPPSAAGAAAVSTPVDSPPRTTMMWLHFLQRILKTLPRTFSSAIEYLVPQESQTIFINASVQGDRGERTKAGKENGLLEKGTIILSPRRRASQAAPVSRRIPSSKPPVTPRTGPASPRSASARRPRRWPRRESRRASLTRATKRAAAGGTSSRMSPPAAPASRPAPRRSARPRRDRRCRSASRPACGRPGDSRRRA